MFNDKFTFNINRVWVVSMATLVCGWTVILAMVIVAQDPSAPPMAALSFLERRTLHWTQWKSGQLENPQKQRRSEYLLFYILCFAFFIYLLESRPQWPTGNEVIINRLFNYSLKFIFFK